MTIPGERTDLGERFVVVVVVVVAYKMGDQLGFLNG